MSELTTSNNNDRQPSSRRTSQSQDAIRRAPLVLPAIGLMAGIALDAAWAPRPWAYAVSFGAVVLALAVPAVRRRASVVVLLMAAALGGLLHHNAYRRVPADHIVHHVLHDGVSIARVRGTVGTTPRIAPPATGPFAPWTYSPDRTSFVIQADAISQDGDFIPATGQVSVTIKEAVMDLAAGDRVELFGKLYRPLPPDNPGEFDWAKWKRRHGVLVGMSCDLQEAVRRLPTDPHQAARRWIGAIRGRIRGVLLDEMLAVGDPATSLLDTMILARRSAIDPSINEAFIRTGCAHYLAASGIHVGMLAVFLYAFARLLGLTERRSAVFIVVATAFYAIMAEPRPAIFRATVLTVAICASIVFQRRGSPFNWLALSAILFLVWRPMELFDAGFQLSYTCVLGILLLSPLVQHVSLQPGRAIRRWRAGALAAELEDEAPQVDRRPGLAERFVVTPLAITVAAWLSALPLVLMHFQRFSPWGWLNTLFVFPFVSVVMFVGFGILWVGLVSPWLAGLLTPLVKVPAGALIWVVSGLGVIPGVMVYTQSPPVAWVLLYYAMLATWVAVHRTSHRAGTRSLRPPQTVTVPRQNRQSRFPFMAAGLTTVGWLTATCVWLWPPGPTDKLTMTVLSVGRGTSIVIELPDGKAMLYDAGCSGSYDPGTNDILPYLAHRAIGRLETAVISHPNLDHFGGLLSVIDRVPTRSVMLNPQFEQLSPPSKPSRRLLDELAERRHTIEVIDSSAGAFRLGGATFEVLWPPAEPTFDFDSNESSIVLRVSYGEQRILLTGDIEKRAQQGLLDSGADLSADVLLLPHHGGVVRNTRQFIEAVDPAYVIRSSSEHGPRSAEKLQPVIGDRRLFNTADDGAVRVVLGGPAVEASAFRRDSTRR